MLKFSPGFDSLLSSHLVIYDTVGEGESEYSNMEYADMNADVQWLEETVYMNTDSENNIYISGTVVTPLYGRLDTIIAVRDSITGGWNTVHIYDTTFYRDLLLDSSDPSIRIHTHHLCPETGFLVKYSPSLDPQWANHLHWVKRSNTENGLASSIYLQTEITGEEVYVCTGFSQGYFGDSVRYYSVVCGMGDTLTTHLYKGAGFIRLNTEDGGYISSGCVPSSCGTGNGYGLAVQNNRVFMQVSYPRPCSPEPIDDIAPIADGIEIEVGVTGVHAYPDFVIKMHERIGPVDGIAEYVHVGANSVTHILNDQVCAY